MRIGSLFSGVGGLELGLEMSGLGEVVWQVERDEFCRSVLAKHWPEVARFDDVCSVGSANLPAVDLICGGFPCQDVSGAGKGAGLAGSRSGLWFEFLRIIDELRPEWVVIENVASGARKWVDVVRAGLVGAGYDAIPFPLSAEDVGAPHERARVFMVARANGLTPGRVAGPVWRPHVATPDAYRIQLRQQSGGCCRASREGAPVATHDHGDPRGDQQSIGPVNDQASRMRGVAACSWPWPAPPELRRVDDGFPSRVDRNRALGNAVVPQCSEVIGWIIRELAENSAIADGCHGHHPVDRPV